MKKDSWRARALIQGLGAPKPKEAKRPRSTAHRLCWTPGRLKQGRMDHRATRCRAPSQAGRPRRVWSSGARRGLSQLERPCPWKLPQNDYYYYSRTRLDCTKSGEALQRFRRYHSVYYSICLLDQFAVFYYPTVLGTVHAFWVNKFYSHWSLFSWPTHRNVATQLPRHSWGKIDAGITMIN
jgi:hypothetical protein